jgi:hypothetical protein
VAELSSKIISSIAGLDPTHVASTIFSIVSKIHEQYEQMQNNKEMCQALKNKVDMINAIVKMLCEIQQVGPCQHTLKELEECLNQCLSVISSIGAEKDSLGKIKSFLSAKGNQSVIVKLTMQLNCIADILNLALTVQTANIVQQISALIAKKKSEDIPIIQQYKTQINEDIGYLNDQITSIKITNTIGQGGSAKVELNFSNLHLPQAPSSPLSFSYRNSVSLAEKLRDIKEKSKNEQDRFVLRELIQLFLDNRGEKIAGKKHEKTSLSYPVDNPTLPGKDGCYKQQALLGTVQHFFC